MAAGPKLVLENTYISCSGSYIFIIVLYPSVLEVKESIWLLFILIMSSGHDICNRCKAKSYILNECVALETNVIHQF